MTQMSLSPMQPGQGFISYSDRLYKIAVNAYYKTKKGFSIHTKDDALVAILFAAFSLEAFINELGTISKQAKVNGNNEKILNELVAATDESSINQSENKSTQAKFLNASKALSQEFKKGEKPYQDFDLLFKLRDDLVHFKPEDKFEIDLDNNCIYDDSTRKIIKKLRDKNILTNPPQAEFRTFQFRKSNGTQTDSKVKSLILSVSNDKAAKWACDTAAEMVGEILNSLNQSPESEFKRENQELFNT
ncbi:MAG: hypothetical protein SAJ11_18170, partial [Jaaginema sp. PMC 1078.18]|nr:hypothetical protein [Jaaginema sp. PMC 1078.18]